MKWGSQIICNRFCRTALVVLIFLSGCMGILNPASASIKEHAYYSENYEMAHSHSVENLSVFLTEKHQDYDLFGYNFWASLEDTTGETTSFFFGLEQKGQKATGGVGFLIKNFENDSPENNQNGYIWSGFENENLVTTINPWSIELSDPHNSSSYIRIELLSGFFGSVNATYRLSADTLDDSGKLIKVNVILNDPFGVINQGYGTTSFFPQYLTDLQRKEIMKLPDKTIGNYLNATKDPMDWQGDYYYALPLMDVLSYTIEYEGKVMSGFRGKSWLDYFVQSYNVESFSNMTGSRWNWIAIQMPEINAAINLLSLTNDTGELSSARLFNIINGKSRNGAHIASHSWEIDKITVDPVIGSEWVSPTGKEYFLTYNITLESSTLPGKLLVEVFKNQELVMSEEQTDYQGLGKVTGTIGELDIHNGQAWLEIEAI